MVSMSTKRKRFAIVLLKGRIIVAGGINMADGRLNTVECYDFFTNQWQPLALMNRKRSSHTLAVHNNRLYATGGYHEDSIELYDPEMNKWNLVIFNLFLV